MSSSQYPTQPGISQFTWSSMAQRYTKLLQHKEIIAINEKTDKGLSF